MSLGWLWAMSKIMGCIVIGGVILLMFAVIMCALILFLKEIISQFVPYMRSEKKSVKDKKKEGK